MPALATWAPEDGVLGAVAPLALASTQPIALVVDLDPHGPAYPSERSLRDLVESGPRAEELTPARRGLAILRNGGVDVAASAEILGLLLTGWPAVVLRLGQATADVPAPVVPVRLLVPGRLFPPAGRGVFQRLAASPRLRPPDGSVVLPPTSRHVVASLFAGRRPIRNRWLASWRRVWELPW